MFSICVYILNITIIINNIIDIIININNICCINISMSVGMKI